MFRDEGQASRAIRSLLATVHLEALWSDEGPTPRALALRRDQGRMLPSDERALFQAVWTLWRPRSADMRLGDLVGSLEEGACAAFCELLVAYKRGPEAVDAWIDERRALLPPPSEAPEAERVVLREPGRERWPTLDELSLDYIHRVLEHERGSKGRAAAVLGIDRRTLDRILSKVRKGRVPSMQTHAGARAPRGEPESPQTDGPRASCTRGRSLP